MIFPKPQRISKISESAIVNDDVKITVEGDSSSFVKEWCIKNGFECASEGNIKIKTIQENSCMLTYIDQSRKLTDEKYLINSKVCDKAIEIKITYAHRHGLWHALNTIGKQILSGEILVGEIEDYPLFQCRGYIEGFYGKPWTPEERADMLQLLASHRMNTYYYAPKDDPYHREKWEELYPEEDLKSLSKLIDLAKECFVDFYFCIAPGLSMRYTSEEDYRSLLKKLRQIYDCGVTNFGLLLDDIPEKLYFKEDIEAFGGETVNAHIYLANRLYDELKELNKNIKLTLCPLQYHGRGDEYFISKLGRGIEPEIDLVWTGHNICSQELTVPEAITFINSTNHRPLYWDNFPVNDAEMQNEMHLGYITGRDCDLYRYSKGLISNCMEFCESSKIPLLTVADYLWNPVAYDPAASWDYAINTVVGKRSGLFKYFADNLLTSCLKVNNSPMLADTFTTAQQELRGGDIMKAFAMITEYKANLTACVEMLDKKDTKLFAELSPWAKKMKLCSDIMNLSFEYLADPEDEAKEKIQEMIYEFGRMPEVLTDFAFREAVETLLRNGFN